MREDLWNRFKSASTAVNKKHQEYFDNLHAKEKENLEAKQAIIEKIKVIVDSIKEEDAKIEWEKLTAQIQEMQEDWRKIGFAPKKYNQSVYAEYRALCDEFFHAKTAYYKGLRNELTDNLNKKRSLVERAQELAENQDWNATADAIRALQTEWKTSGPVARKYSDELWKQFTGACDSFFNAKREAAKESREENRRQRVARAGKSGESLYRVRENLRQEIKVAENNILFFSGKSKTANKLVDDMQKKIDALKKQLAEVEEKMRNEE